MRYHHTVTRVRVERPPFVLVPQFFGRVVALERFHEHLCRLGMLALDQRFAGARLELRPVRR